MDIPRLKGVPYLDTSVAIYPEDLEAWQKQAGIQVGSGDIVFVRTGRWARRAAKGPWDASANSAGLHVSSVKWLKERDVAMVGSDAASDVDAVARAWRGAASASTLADRDGHSDFDNCDLEKLSEETNKRKRWDFLLTASPLAVTGGTGSPINRSLLFEGTLRCPWDLHFYRMLLTIVLSVATTFWSGSPTATCITRM